MVCKGCEGHDVAEVGFSTIASGVNFYFCRHCENRWWLSDGDTVGLDRILQETKVFARR